MKMLLFYYIRIGLIMHLLLLAFIPFRLFFEECRSGIIGASFWAFAIFIFPVFLILPGIIYDDEYKSSYHGFTPDQFGYSLFLGLTLGIGPLVIYFWKYDKKIKDAVFNVNNPKP